MKILDFTEIMNIFNITDYEVLHLTVYNEDLEHPENSFYKLTYKTKHNELKEIDYVLDKNETTGILMPILQRINTLDTK
jgi:hypothetical protein